MDKLVLIDGHSILNRAFYGVPDLTNSEGLHTNAVYGFLNIMFKILEEEKADHLAVAFDLKEPTFRHKMYEAYKGTRKPMPEELRQQVPVIKEALSLMNIPIMTLSGYEADDILGTVAKRSAAQGIDVSVISGDRDLLQLADTHIKIRIPKTSRGTTQVKDYYPENVKEEYKVTPLEFIDVKALMGDASDNIPGVPSIGEKTATALIEKYGSIENAYDHIEEVKPPRAKKALEENFELAKMSKELATICIDCPIDFSYEDAHVGNLYTKEACQFMKKLEFKSMVSRFGEEAIQEADLEKHFKTISEFSEVEKVFADACLTEHVGIHVFTDAAENVIGVSLCYGEEQIFFIRCCGFVTSEYLKTKVENLFEHVSDISVIDLKRHLHCIKVEENDRIFDLSLAAYLLNPLKDTYHYDDIARDFLAMTIPSKEDLTGKGTIEKALEEENEKANILCCYIAYVSWKSKTSLEEKLAETGMMELYKTIELPLVYSLYRMEKAGVHVDRNKLKQYGDQLKIRIEKTEQEIYEETGVKFNINSPKQLGEVLFDHLKLPNGKKTKTGYSTAAEVLEKLATDYPVVQKILDYRQLTKLNSTYADGLAAFISSDDRIHGKFNQTITATGRISSTEPNLQNIPIRMELGREIRKVFVPEEGCVFIDADYSQIELRVLAHMSGDDRLISAYKQAQDIHAITASQVFHIPLEEVTSQQRRNAKSVNFGIVYGISAFGLSEDLSITRKEALEYINKYFETYPNVKIFLDNLITDAKEKGYVTSLFGRRRPVPELKSSNFMQRSFGERVAMNSPIQGTAADIMKIAMNHVDRELRKAGLKSRIVLQVHDELLIEAPVEECEAAKRIVEEQMKNAVELKVSLEVDANIGETWFDAK